MGSCAWRGELQAQGGGLGSTKLGKEAWGRVVVCTQGRQSSLSTMTIQPLSPTWVLSPSRTSLQVWGASLGWVGAEDQQPCPEGMQQTPPS